MAATAAQYIGCPFSAADATAASPGKSFATCSMAAAAAGFCASASCCCCGCPMAAASAGSCAGASCYCCSAVARSGGHAVSSRAAAASGMAFASVAGDDAAWMTMDHPSLAEVPAGGVAACCC